MNTLSLVGNLGADPILRETGSGKKVCSFNLAVDDRVVHRDGDDVSSEKRTDWIPIVVWGRQAEICAAHLQKGSQVAIEGSLRSRSWEDAEQKKRYVLECNARNVKFLARIKTTEVAAEA